MVCELEFSNTLHGIEIQFDTFNYHDMKISILGTVQYLSAGGAGANQFIILRKSFRPANINNKKNSCPASTY